MNIKKASEKTVLEYFYEDALLINEIVEELGYPQEAVRLFNYIHMRCMLTGVRGDYFNSPDQRDVEHLTERLGIGPNTIADTLSVLNSKSASEKTKDDAYSNLLIEIHDGSKTTKNPIFNENMKNLELYTNHTFREEKLEIYRNEILPRLPIYRKSNMHNLLPE